MENPRVIIVMGSDSDLPQMAAAAQILEDLQIPFWNSCIVGSPHTRKNASDRCRK